MSESDDLPTTAPATEDAVTLRLDTEALAALAAEAKTIATAAPARVSLNLERTGDCIDRYRLINELGQGGFGTVWLAEQSEPIRREVALKVIKAGMDSREIIARFEAERQALALMDHPNIAAVLDAGTTENGRPYFVMELVKGVPITEYCDAHHLTIRQRLELFIPVCQAVQHAHQKAILHRDLKPSNILVTKVDDKPVPKVIDFGIAKALGTSPEAALQGSLLQTQAGMVIGTPQYMSPEQAGAAQDLDTRSDIYTLGVILFELLTGDTPLPHEALRKAALDEVLRLVREAEPKRPSSRVIPITNAVRQTSTERGTEPAKLTRTLRGDLDWITLKALEKERERRYSSAAAFAEDLQRHLNDEPVEAGPPSAFYRFRKLVRRNRLAVTSAAAIIILLIVGIGVSTWQWSVAVKEREQKQLQFERAEKALHDLKRTAPAFEAQSKALLTEGRMEAALEKIEFAIDLAPDNADYRLSHANLLEALQKLSEAAEEYTRVLKLRPGDTAAKTNLALCNEVIAMNAGAPELSLALRAKLLQAIKDQHRDLETTRLARLVEDENSTAFNTLKARLSAITKEKNFGAGRMTFSLNFNDSKTHVKLDLSGLEISNLNVLRDQPISELDLHGCKISDLRPLAGLPLVELNLNNCQQVTDLSPLRGMKLKKLAIEHSRVRNLEPLRGMPLEYLSLKYVNEIHDLSPLQGMPLSDLNLNGLYWVHELSPLVDSKLQVLDISGTDVRDLTPLRNLPLRFLSIMGRAATAYGKPLNCEVLSNHPSLQTFHLPGDLTDIRFLHTLPKLAEVDFPKNPFFKVGTTVTEFWAAYDPDAPEISAARNALMAAGIKVPLPQMTALDKERRLRIYLNGPAIGEAGRHLDLTPLRTLPVRTIAIGTAVSDLEPLRGMPLTALFVSGFSLPGSTVGPSALNKFDVAPLADCHQLEELLLPVNLDAVENLNNLRSHPKLRLISTKLGYIPVPGGYKPALSDTIHPAQTAEDFWNAYDAK